MYLMMISDWKPFILLFIRVDSVTLAMASGLLLLEFDCSYLVHFICKSAHLVSYQDSFSSERVHFLDNNVFK